jgi:serine protease AprX
MSPKSKWIHCRSMKISTREWSPETFIGCLQFFLAPTDVKGKNPNPKKRPHTTSHSYGCGSIIGCPNPDSLRLASEALMAAGVFVFVSAGNTGPTCNTIDAQPSFYEKVVTVGATDFNTNALAYFSSRGYVIRDNSSRLKPDIVAPGVNILSSNVGGSYKTMSGTQYSSPIVSGAIALLWNAVPELKRKIQETLKIIYASATPMESLSCSSHQKVPNNLYGHGVINIEKAVEIALEKYKK